ncbi:hypothetical protein ACHAWF_005451, partial [Thalassiosira exigua]
MGTTAGTESEPEKVTVEVEKRTQCRGASQSDEHPPATIDGGRKAAVAGAGGGGDRCLVSGRDPRTGTV